MSYVSRDMWGPGKITNNGEGKHSDGTQNIHPSLFHKRAIKNEALKD